MEQDINKTEPEREDMNSHSESTGMRRIVLVAATLVLATSSLVLLAGLVHTTAEGVVLGLTIPVVGVAIFLAYKNHLLPAQIIISAATFVVLTFFLFAGEGVRDATITGYSATVVIAGLLLGQTGVLIFGFLSTVVLALLAYTELAGIFPTPYSIPLDAVDANIFWILHLALSILIFFLIRHLSLIAENAKKNEGVLFQTNKELYLLKDKLQESVDERVRDLENRALQLQVTSQVAQDALIFQNVSELLPNLVDLISEKFGYYHAGIFLLDDKGEYAILQAASSDGGKKMLERGHQLQVGGEGIVGATAAEKRPHIALDVGIDAVYFSNPDLPETRSEIALPLLSQNDVLGVLDIQSPGAQAFNQQDLEIFQTLANQLALAIQNARLLEKSQENITQLKALTDAQTQRAWKAHLEHRSHRFLYTPLGIKRLKKDGDFNAEEGDERTNIPITLRGKTIGKITLNRLSKQWSNKEKALISDVAEQIGLAIENTRLVDETRDQANRDQLVSEFSSKLRETLDMDTVIKTAIEEMKKTFNLDEVEMRLNTSDKNKTED